MILGSCVTNVPGMWTFWQGAAEGVEEQQRLHFQSTVRRAYPCTTSCCPQVRAHSPCSSTHQCTPARTLGFSGGTLFLSTDKISNCRLCFARRWDLRRRILFFVRTTPSPCARYATAPLAPRCWTCCPWRLYESCAGRGAAGAVRARACRSKRLARPVHVIY